MLGYRIESRFTILKLRSFTCVILVVLGTIWTGLLCVDAFVKQGFRSTAESVATIILLSSQVAMTIIIPIVVLLGSSDSMKGSRWFNHAWFELLCLYLIVAYQCAGALVFSLLSPKFVCRGDADEQGACQLVNVYISICSWITPVILLFYCTYATVKCFRLSTRYSKVWRTPFTIMPWNPNLLDLDFESKRSSSTLNKPRTGSLDEIKTVVSSSRLPETSSTNPPNATRSSASGPSVRASTQSVSTASPNLSSFPQNPSSNRSSTQLQSKPSSKSEFPPRVQSYSRPRPALSIQLPSNLPPSSRFSEWRQSQNDGKHGQSQLYHQPSNSLSRHESRLTFQQQLPLPPTNLPPVAHPKLGPPIPLTLPSIQNKRITPYYPTYYYYPPSPSTRRPARLSAQVMTGPAASRTSLQPSSLYPGSALETSRKSFNINFS